MTLRLYNKILLCVNIVPMTCTQQDVFTTEDNTPYGLTVFSQDTTDIDDHHFDYLHVYDISQQ